MVTKRVEGGRIRFGEASVLDAQRVNECPRRIRSETFGEIVIHRDDIREFQAWEAWTLHGTAEAFADYGEAGQIRARMNDARRAATSTTGATIARERAARAMREAAKAIRNLETCEADAQRCAAEAERLAGEWQAAKVAEARKLFGPRESEV